VEKLLKLHTQRRVATPGLSVKDARHLVVVPSSAKASMVDKIPYWPYRPATDLRYLTGHTEPNAALVIDVPPGGKEFGTFLFVGDPDPAQEKWEGPKTTPQQVPDKYGLDEGHPVSRLGQFLARQIESDPAGTEVWYDHLNPHDSNVHKAVKGTPIKDFVSPKQALHETRVIKSPTEIGLMRKSCQIASDAISETIRRAGSLESEAQVFATVDYQCRMRGASHLAYPPVVAAGDHATVIHYTDNSNQPIDRKDMMLMDAGCEYEGYSSDITRTWPLGGAGGASSAQKRVFEAVYDVQTHLIEALRRGSLGERPLTIDSLYHESQRLFRPHLVELGLLDQDADGAEARVLCSELCPHHVSHYLGMDVHDTPLVSRNIPLAPGMVITVEPGLYFPRGRQIRHLDASRLSPDLLGIGTRLEDDVLITRDPNGNGLTCEVLTESCPKSMEDMEKVMA